jgi:hypothetical protein
MDEQNALQHDAHCTNAYVDPQTMVHDERIAIGREREKRKKICQLPPAELHYVQGPYEDFLFCPCFYGVPQCFGLILMQMFAWSIKFFVFFSAVVNPFVHCFLPESQIVCQVSCTIFPSKL